MTAESPSGAVTPLGWSNIHADSPLKIKLPLRTETSCFTPMGLTGLLLSPSLQNETQNTSSITSFWMRLDSLLVPLLLEVTGTP